MKPTQPLQPKPRGIESPFMPSLVRREAERKRVERLRDLVVCCAVLAAFGWGFVAVFLFTFLKTK